MNTNQEKIDFESFNNLSVSEKTILSRQLFESLEKMMVDVDKISISFVEDSLACTQPKQTNGMAKRPKCLN
jgi:hypothetical protein